MVHIYLDLHRFTIEIMEHTWILRDCFSTYPKRISTFSPNYSKQIGSKKQPGGISLSNHVDLSPRNCTKAPLTP